MLWTSITYFNEKEFTCPCCGEQHMDMDFVKKLDYVRQESNTVVLINSGWRCQRHNERLGGSPTSSHLLGFAVDVNILSSRARFNLVRAALKMGIPRIGVGRNFIHLDVDINKPGSLMWTYDKE